MRFLKLWHYIEANSRGLILLDIAYFVVLTPLLLFVKAPMLLFLLLVAILLIFKKRRGNITLIVVALLGFFAIFLSLYGAFNFLGLSRLKIFVELIIYLLLLAVSLQRLSGKINLYLLISPALLLALSLFFFKSIFMLFYLIFEIFILLWLILSYFMQTSFIESLKMAGSFFALSLPWVVILFIFFPRISFEHASYGFHGDNIRRTGHDGKMYLDTKALLVPSNRIVMEVSFPKRVPADNRLYFRGSVLYKNMIDHWEALPHKIKRRFSPKHYLQNGMVQKEADTIAYKVSLYPTFKTWLYQLDLPIEAPKGARIDADFEVKLSKPISEVQHYEAGSVLNYRYGKYISKDVLKYALDVNATRNPKSAKLAKELILDYPKAKERLNALLNIFKEANLSYSLQPKPLDLNHSTDDFLFNKKEGYCVHFANSFVTLARLAKLPARVVTGYKAKHSNSVKNYLVIREKDAHAWTEIYIKEHWIRIDPTTTAKRIDIKSAKLLSKNSSNNIKGELQTINLYILYWKYQIQSWILNYSHFRQMKLLNSLKDRDFALKFISSLVGLIIFSILLMIYLRRTPCPNKISCLMARLFKRLKKEGYTQKTGETLHQLFSRYSSKDIRKIEDIQNIDRLYHQVRYSKESYRFKNLRRAILDFLRKKY